MDSVHSYLKRVLKVREFMASNGLAANDLRRELDANGWTQHEWDVSFELFFRSPVCTL